MEHLAVKRSELATLRVSQSWARHLGAAVDNSRSKSALRLVNRAAARDGPRDLLHDRLAPQFYDFVCGTQYL